MAPLPAYHVSEPCLNGRCSPYNVKYHLNLPLQVFSAICLGASIAVSWFLADLRGKNFMNCASCGMFGNCFRIRNQEEKLAQRLSAIGNGHGGLHAVEQAGQSGK
jgi:hypothetical protein